MADENDKTDHKVPRFDYLNKSLSRDTKIKTYLQTFKCAALAKFGTKGSVLFLPLYNTKPDDIPTSLHFARSKKIADVAPVFLKMVDANEDETWFKMQV
jgi:hypothetical protein